MASSVSICSNALLMLGDKPIAAFTEVSKAAQVASNLYTDAKRAFLRSHPWNAAIRRVVLSPEAAAPAFDFAHQFTLPPDCVRVLSIGTDTERPDYKIEGRLVLMDGTVLRLTYLSEASEGEWDALMVKAMTLIMAAEMAYAITASASLAESLAAQAQRAAKEAKAADGQEDQPDAFDDSPLLDSRFVGARSI